MTTPTANDWSLLLQLLQRDTTHSEQLLDLLRAERKALESRDYAQFEALITPKQSALEQLERNLSVRRQHLQQMGFSSDTDALQAAELRVPPVARAWLAAAELWRECQAANQVNEQISRRTRQVVEQVLDALRGQHAQSTTYDASGAAHRPNSGRTISSA